MVPTAEAAMIFQIAVRLNPDTTYEEVDIVAEVCEVGIVAGVCGVGIAAAA